jgi:hypothetical protein
MGQFDVTHTFDPAVALRHRLSLPLTDDHDGASQGDTG